MVQWTRHLLTLLRWSHGRRLIQGHRHVITLATSAEHMVGCGAGHDGIFGGFGLKPHPARTPPSALKPHGRPLGQIGRLNAPRAFKWPWLACPCDFSGCRKAQGANEGYARTPLAPSGLHLPLHAAEIPAGLAVGIQPLAARGLESALAFAFAFAFSTLGFLSVKRDHLRVLFRHGFSRFEQRVFRACGLRKD